MILKAATGFEHSAVIDKNHQLLVWGGNKNSQLTSKVQGSYSSSPVHVPLHYKDEEYWAEYVACGTNCTFVVANFHAKSLKTLPQAQPVLDYLAKRIEQGISLKNVFRAPNEAKGHQLDYSYHSQLEQEGYVTKDHFIAIMERENFSKKVLREIAEQLAELPQNETEAVIYYNELKDHIYGWRKGLGAVFVFG